MKNYLRLGFGFQWCFLVICVWYLVIPLTVDSLTWTHSSLLTLLPDLTSFTTGNARREAAASSRPHVFRFEHFFGHLASPGAMYLLLMTISIVIWNFVLFNWWFLTWCFRTWPMSVEEKLHGPWTPHLYKATFWRWTRFQCFQSVFMLLKARPSHWGTVQLIPLTNVGLKSSSMAINSFSDTCSSTSSSRPRGSFDWKAIKKSGSIKILVI